MTVQPKRVRDYMMDSPLTVPPDREIMHVIRLLVDEDLSGCPVVSSDGALVGFLTERDVIGAAIQAGYFDEIGGTVADYMSTNVHTVHPEDALMDVAELFTESPFRRCPVIEDGRLVGLICRRDVLRAMTESAWFSPDDAAES
jgi:CBS domain-containing protein